MHWSLLQNFVSLAEEATKKMNVQGTLFADVWAFLSDIYDEKEYWCSAFQPANAGTFDSKTNNFSEATFKRHKQDRNMNDNTPLRGVNQHTLDKEMRLSHEKQLNFQRTVAKESHVVKALNAPDWKKIIYEHFPQNVAQIFEEELSKKGTSASHPH